MGEGNKQSSFSNGRFQKNVLVLCEDEKEIGGFLNELLSYYNVLAMSSIADAVNTIAINNIDIILIDINHHNSKVSALPSLINNILPICVVVYSIENTVADLLKLKESSVGYQLSPPINLRAFQKIIDRYSRDREKEQHIRIARGGRLAERNRKAGSFQKNSSSDVRDSILYACTKDALQSALQSASTYQLGDRSTDGKDLTEDLTCIKIDTKELSGVLFAFIEKNILDENVGPNPYSFMENIKKALIENLHMRGQYCKMNNLFGMRTDSPHFLSWLESDSIFHLKTNHFKSRMTLAFVELPETAKNVLPREEDCKIELKLGAILESTVVDFSVYIYLPKNKKHILYFKNGERVDSVRLKKLQDLGVQQVYIDTNDLRSFEKYSIKNVIAERLRNYQNQLAAC